MSLKRRVTELVKTSAHSLRKRGPRPLTDLEESSFLSDCLTFFLEILKFDNEQRASLLRVKFGSSSSFPLDIFSAKCVARSSTLGDELDLEPLKLLSSLINDQNVVSKGQVLCAPFHDRGRSSSLPPPQFTRC